MSFDLTLMAMLEGDLGVGDPDAVQAVLARPGVTVQFDTVQLGGFDGHDFASIETADGGSCEMIGARKSKYAGFMIALRGGWTRQVSQLILDMAKAGNLVILDNQADTATLVHESQRRHLPAELQNKEPSPVVVSSAEELERLLQEGYDAWRQVRDRIAKPPESE